MEQVALNIRRELTEYIKYNKIQSLVLGVSGGIDSAVIAALVKPIALKQGIPLIGVSLPMEGNKEEEVARAEAIGKAFCSWLHTSHIDHISDALKTHMNLSPEDKIRFGNIKARLRMIYLYDIARASNGMVLSTDNWTELMLGFWTLHGDVGDYGCIQNLTKSEVYDLADALLYEVIEDPKKYEPLDACRKAIPTDGLGITDSDYDQLGVKDYQEADEIIQAYLYLSDKQFPLTSTERARLDELKATKVIQRHLATEFKRNNPCNISRPDLFKNYT